MAAGQLGGVLYPTHEITDKQLSDAIAFDFGTAIEKWNRHEYPGAIQLFESHCKKFPNSPWCSEAKLHIGCDATYNGRYPAAEAAFNELITKHRDAITFGEKMMLNKARQRLALVKVEQNNLDEATVLFTELAKDSPDWKLRTYAMHWIQRLSTYAAAKEALLNCGADALGYALEKEGHAEAANQVRQQLPKTLRGHSIQSLVELAANQGFELVALNVSPVELARLPLPAVVHINQGASGDKGHYWVLDKVSGTGLELFDPQSKRRFHQTLDEFLLQWSGKVLVFSKKQTLLGRKLTLDEMEESLGGCCGVPAAPSDQGDPGNNGDGGPPGGPPPSPCGAPTWRVNVVNMNFYVTDIPMWYDSSIGPQVRIQLSYNSQSSIAHYEPFGSKWTFNYGGYLVMDTSGAITVFMPDGKMDVYTPNGGGGYNRPYKVYNTLSLIGPNHYELSFPDGTVYVYQPPPGTSSQQPFLTAIRDAYGQTLTLGYDATVNLKTITDAQGKIFTLAYSSSGVVTNVADPFGRNANFEYDTNKNLVKITDMGGYWSSFTYDKNVFMTSLGDDRGTWLFRTEPADGIPNGSNQYPPPGTAMWQNYRITATNPLGQVEEYQYNGYYSYSWHVSARDYVPWVSSYQNSFSLNVPRTRFNFIRVGSGSHGEISQITYPQGDYLQYGYDTITGDRTSVTDSHGHAWHYTYNSLGRANSVTDAKGTLTTLAYSTNGVDLLSVSNGLGKILASYNVQHGLLSFTDRMSNTTTFTYNGFGQMSSQVDALGITNQYLYDANNNFSAFVRASQTVETFLYDSVGRVRMQSDATGLTVTNDYNGLNQTTRRTYPDGRFESYVYSTCCPRILDSTTDRGGRITVFAHDALKHLTQIINPEGGIVQFGYDANGNRIQLIDPNGNTTTYAYDLDNRLTNKTYADGKGTSLAYDQGGLLSGRTNARGIVTSYTYDANHNLLTTVYSDGTPGVTNTFDAFNRLIAVKDSLGTNSYTYDANSRRTSFDGPWTNDTINYSFDALGRQTNIVTQGGQPAAYVYDALNRVSGVQVGGASYSYTFAGANPLVQRLDRPNGSFTIYQYDNLNRLTDIANKKSAGQIINEFSYTYNAQDMRDSETISNGLSFTFTTNQLVTYNYNSLNQVLTSAPPSQIFAYDNDGNMTKGYTPDGYAFIAAYDAKNRLKSLIYTNGNGVVLSNQYIYGWTDFLAQVKQHQNGLLTNDARIVRAGYFPLQERDPSNTVTRQYAWGLNIGGGIGGLIDLSQNGQNYSYLYDGNGNAVSLVDGSQTPAAAYAYEPFGLQIMSNGSLDQPMRFSTKRYDSSTGLIDFGYRYYSPALGRWLSLDPIAEKGGINLYAYVGNNPIMRSDPYGLMNCFQKTVCALGICISIWVCPDDFPEPGIPCTGTACGQELPDPPDKGKGNGGNGGGQSKCMGPGPIIPPMSPLGGLF